jgi:hypothetical protein
VSACKRLGCRAFGSSHDGVHVHEESGRHVSATAADGEWSLQVRAVVPPHAFQKFLTEVARVQRVVRAMNEKGIR